MTINTLMEKFDSKTITSAGGIVLALFLGYALYQVTTRDIANIANAVMKQSEEIKSGRSDLNGTLLELKKSIDANTQATRDLQLYIGKR